MPNSISEWFGHRVYPLVAAAPRAQADQKDRRCPFLTEALEAGRPQSCIKPDNSQGVCTVNSDSNGQSQDWVVCPYRTISSPLFAHLAGRMFVGNPKARLHLVAASALELKKTRSDVLRKMRAGTPVYTYFIDKLGGEIDLPGSIRSPKFKLDTTIIEILPGPDATPSMGRYAVIEIQTMDFHGSYKKATTNLRDALRLHRGGFAGQLNKNPQWASENIEGPNIANVFKRTIYQILFKLRLGQQPDCVGCVLALPQAVWDSWQPHLGSPRAVQQPDGTWQLDVGVSLNPARKQPGWLCIFDIERDSSVTPNPIVVKQEIRIDAQLLGRLAFEKAPEGAMEAIGGDAGLKAIIRRRLAIFWPEAFSP